MTQEEVERRERTRPRPFDLSNPDERYRLLRETLGYAKVSLLNKEGTDLEGRRYALEALREAISNGFDLVPGDGTPHYSDGTSATGVAPLPAWSSDQQDAMVRTIKNARAFIEWPAGADRQRDVLKALEDVLALFP